MRQHEQARFLEDTCQVEFCGNNRVDPGERCDDGNTVAGDGCSPDCLSNEECGNGIVDVVKGEQCDCGTDASNLPPGCTQVNSDTAPDACRVTGCQLPRCSDGVADPSRNEVCDEGGDNSDAADAASTKESNIGAPICDAPDGAGWVMLCDYYCDLAGCTNVLDYFEKEGATAPTSTPACASFSPGPLPVTGAGAGDGASRTGFSGGGAAGLSADWSVAPISRD